MIKTLLIIIIITIPLVLYNFMTVECVFATFHIYHVDKK